MRALIIRFEDHLMRVPLPATEVSIGSAISNGIVLPFSGVSRIHARLTPAADGAILTDTGSKNRLIVNGERADRVELRAGIAVQIGRAQVMIEEVPTDDLIAAYEVGASGAERRTPGETAGFDVDEASNRSREALALVRRIESLTDAARLRARADFLAEGRTVLDAESMVAFEQAGAGDLVLVATVGAPEESVLDAIARTIARGRGDVRDVARTATGAVAVSGRRRKQSAAGIAASFARRDIHGWEADLLDYLRLRLVARDASDETPAIRHANLVLPAGMVEGSSPAMTALLASIAATVRSRLDVLLLGETGTGKEVFARLIHASGPTAGGPFVAINCAAIPGELLEAELFGVQARVATGVDPRAGLFAQANGGSIFLDEIGELPDGLQAKLLRVLQEREVLPIGASAPRRIDVRVIAASNRDLHQLRPDLYYRLRGLEFHIPPLRERKEDIPALALAFVERAAAEYGKRIRGVSRSAMQLLTAHDWPGNVRELQSEVARAVLVALDGGVLQTDHFAPLRATVPGPPPPVPDTLQDRVDAVERETIVDALRRSNGNKSAAAKLLGITRNGLAMKMERLGIR